MQVLRWTGFALLIWALFTGIAYALVPILTDGWGNQSTTFIGLGLIIVSGAALTRFDPRR